MDAKTIQAQDPGVAAAEPRRRKRGAFWKRFGRVLFARPLLVLTPMICALIGGAVVVMTVPARYEATSRVMLDIIKPDPITGFRVGVKTYDAYVSTQARIIHDEQVAGRVVEEMGWLENPDMIAAWKAAPDKGADFKRWVARRITFGTGAELVPETNIMAIKFQSTDPDLARVIADNIRTAYLEENVEQHRASARAGATALGANVERDRARLLELQLLKAGLERDTGIVMSDGAPDADSKHLSGLLRAYKPTVAGPARVDKVTQIQLAQLDAAIAQASQTMGPNNPALVQLQQRRAILAQHAAPAQAASPLSTTSYAALSSLIGRQMDKIMSQGDKALALKLVQDEIKRRRKLYEDLSQKQAYLSQIGQVSDAGLTAIGATTVDRKPVFPNLPLIFGGAGGLGLLIGILLASFAESLNRRVRVAEDLAAVAPVLGVLPGIKAADAGRVVERRPRREKPARPPKEAKRKAKAPVPA